MAHPRRLLPLLGLATAVSAAHAQARPGDTLQLGIAHFMAQRYDSAAILLAAAIRRSPEAAAPHVWLAETERRMDSTDAALVEARRALALDHCSSLAHDVLAELYDSQFGSTLDERGDSTWAHLRAAIGCDSTDGNAWMHLWIQAMRRGDSLTERRALRSLVATQFLTPVWMRHARWVLELLPPRAIALAGGDMDTYPAVAAQEALGIRRDVAVVNTPMLDLRWYAELLSRRYSLPLPPLDRVDSTETLGQAIIAFWRTRAAAGTLGRPLAVLASMGGESAHAGPGVPRLAGPYWLVVASDSTPDRARIDSAYRSAERVDWRGEIVAASDMSPIRRTTAPPAVMVAVAAVYDAWNFVDQRDAVQAWRRVGWAKAMLDGSGVADRWEGSLLDPLRKALTPP